MRASWVLQVALDSPSGVTGTFRFHEDPPEWIKAKIRMQNMDRHWFSRQLQAGAGFARSTVRFLLNDASE